MQRILLTTVFLVVSILSTFAQKLDFTTYDVVATSGKVSLVVKDNDYRMVIGSLKKPKANMLFGYSKEQAITRLETILSYSSENSDYTKVNRHVMFSGKPYRLTITGEGRGEIFKFKEEDSTTVFEVSAQDCVLLKQVLMKLDEFEY